MPRPRLGATEPLLQDQCGKHLYSCSSFIRSFQKCPPPAVRVDCLYYFLPLLLPCMMASAAPTRKRERGEAPEDYARRDAFKAVRGTRKRLQSVPTAGITAHFFSVVYYALINVTRDLALKPIHTNAPRVYVFGPNAASDEQLRSRIELYDRGVDPELFVNLRTPLCWIPYNEQYLVCPSVGEVMLAKTYQLLGKIHNGKVYITDEARGVIVLLACHVPKDGDSVDHILWSQPLNDSRPNVRWGTWISQSFNRRPSTAVNGDALSIQVESLKTGACTLFSSQTLAAGYRGVSL